MEDTKVQTEHEAQTNPSTKCKVLNTAHKEVSAYLAGASGIGALELCPHFSHNKFLILG